MPSFMPGIHAFLAAAKAWMAGTSPAMTWRELRLSYPPFGGAIKSGNSFAVDALARHPGGSAVIGEIRREIENRLAEAADGRALIQLSRADGNVVLLQGDLTCETDHVEGTDHDGNWVEVPYAAIKAVSLASR
jgi:hypothetical protein